jgi:Fe-S cluster assembly ATP-binding protein
MEALKIKGLKVEIEGKEIINSLNLDIEQGKLCAIMGPNGSGKSTLAHVLMGHPKYKVTGGEIIFKGKNILELKPDERAKLGIYLAFQYPIEVQGISFLTFMWASYKGRFSNNGKIKSIIEFKKYLEEKLALVGLDKTFVTRELNFGFSGGEKKRAEIVQMMILEPEIAIMDETDSGLDIDSLRVVAENVNKIKNPNLGILIITHYQRILNYLHPDYVHVMHKGRIIQSGTDQLAEELEKHGYANVIKNG